MIFPIPHGIGGRLGPATPPLTPRKVKKGLIYANQAKKERKTPKKKKKMAEGPKKAIITVPRWGDNKDTASNALNRQKSLKSPRMGGH